LEEAWEAAGHIDALVDFSRLRWRDFSAFVTATGRAVAPRSLRESLRAAPLTCRPALRQMNESGRIAVARLDPRHFAQALRFARSPGEGFFGGAGLP
jgi:hypothetical protein